MVASGLLSATDSTVWSSYAISTPEDIVPVFCLLHRLGLSLSSSISFNLQAYQKTAAYCYLGTHKQNRGQLQHVKYYDHRKHIRNRLYGCSLWHLQCDSYLRCLQAQDLVLQIDELRSSQ